MVILSFGGVEDVSKRRSNSFSATGRWRLDPCWGRNRVDSILYALCWENPANTITPSWTNLQNRNASPKLAPFSSKKPLWTSFELLKVFSTRKPLKVQDFKLASLSHTSSFYLHHCHSKSFLSFLDFSLFSFGFPSAKQHNNASWKFKNQRKDTYV